MQCSSPLSHPPLGANGVRGTRRTRRNVSLTSRSRRRRAALQPQHRNRVRPLPGSASLSPWLGISVLSSWLGATCTRWAALQPHRQISPSPRGLRAAPWWHVRHLHHANLTAHLPDDLNACVHATHAVSSPVGSSFAAHTGQTQRGMPRAVRPAGVAQVPLRKGQELPRRHSRRSAQGNSSEEFKSVAEQCE